ncbi:hypothetical protein QYF56_22740 [Paenibacillus polymyxa]|nr:hypothetical protein [Paenibacillus polymyxa]
MKKNGDQEVIHTLAFLNSYLPFELPSDLSRKVKDRIIKMSSGNLISSEE